MPTPQLTLVIEGSPAEKSRVLLTDFLRELNLFLQVLNETDRHVTSRREPSTYYRIIDLRHSSPATVVVEAIPRDPELDVSERTVSELFGILRTIRREGGISEPLSTPLLVGIRDMTSPIGKTVASLRVETNGDSVELDNTFRKQVVDLLRPEQTFPGAVRGMLEAINLHMGVNVFRIYPDVGPSKLTCHFPADLQSDAISGVGRFVEVRGILKYKTASPHPHEIAVEDIIVLPSEEDLPSLYELRGAAPDATGSLSSEDFVRQLRNEAA